MVTRKPVPANLVPAPLSHAANNPPYPTSSSMPSDPKGMHPGYEHINSSIPSAPNGGDTRSRGSSVSSHDTWNSGLSDDEDEPESGVPEPLKVSRKQSPEKREELPASLRAGPPSQTSSSNQTLPQPPHPPPSWQQPQNTCTGKPLRNQNPYLQTQNGPQLAFGSEPSQSIWGEGQSTPVPPTFAPPPPPGASSGPPNGQSVQAPIVELADMSLEKQDEQSLPPSAGVVQPVIAGRSIENTRSPSSNPWQNDMDRARQREESHNQITAPLLLDEGPRELGTSLPNVQSHDKALQQLPNLTTIEIPKASATLPAGGQPETPGTKAARQRSELYHIKHVNWFDASADQGKGNMRRTPILTQNANGPCPLLALVNALSLSTPAHADTALLETLRTREQVTLGLLLDAVFEELVRKSESSGQDMPDIGELYSFLITLHTGMNVNPRFVVGKQPSILQTQDGSEPGGFEQTREMRLYGAFDIPLIHGWTSPPDSKVYNAFERSAPTFDEGLNLQFAEAELEDKLRTQGLSREEQQVFEDITTLKHFLANYPTQLSDFGLDVINRSMKPGQMAILFRNDHFTTLYKDPKNGTLMTLVTDAGFSTHDEIVWESLVDVSGSASEFFSGDFRLVGNSSGSEYSREGESSQNGWETVQSRNKSGKAPSQKAVATTALSEPSSSNLELPSNIQRTTSEQEDHDLALALQLQEEEEDNNRREAQRREREEKLSRQFLDQERQEQPPQIPPRRNQASTSGRSNSNVNIPVRPAPAISASARTDNDTVPPPTYEQAASDRPYREAGSTPSAPRQGNALGALSALDAQRQQSAFAAQSALHQGQQTPGNRRRTSAQNLPGGRRYGSGQYPGNNVPGNTNDYGNSGLGAGAGRIEERCVVM